MIIEQENREEQLLKGGAVRRTVSIPQWMDRQAAETGLSHSRILQEALAERLGV
jgi:hypothetical protein